MLSVFTSVSSLLLLTILANYDIAQANPQGRNCCYALNANCLACHKGRSKEDYCQEFPETLGCDALVRPDKLLYQYPNWFDQNNYLQTPQPFAPNSNPAIIVARKKRSSVSCKIHERVCKYWCRIAGHSSGTCDIEDECLCSEEDLEKYICDPDEEGPGNKTQHTLCAGWCQLKGKQSGDCDVNAKECVCTEETLAVKHAKCIDDTICSMWCQIKERKATGKCEGQHNWECVCKSAPKDKDNEVE